jgi:uncharacterized membrane protein SirB2
MTKLEIFHTVIFILLGIFILSRKKETRKSKYIDLCIGILALLIAAYDIVVTGFGIAIF